MRHLPGWLGGIGLLTLCAGCLSIPPFPPPDAPASTAPAAPTHAPVEASIAASLQGSNGTPAPTSAETATFAPDFTPAAAVTPAPHESQVAASCGATGGQMSVAFVNSPVLARRVPFSLYLPPCYEANPTRLYPVLYLLHGANTDQTQWPDLNVQPDADALIEGGGSAPFVVVMPDGDYISGKDYGAFVLRDLVPHVEQTLHVAADRKDRAIGGLSQGGYWALDLALAHPDLFSAVGGHSAATDRSLTDLLSSNQSPDLSTLRIYLDVGNEDPLAPGVAAFAAALRAQSLAPIYHVYPGAHNRPYWRSHTSEYLAFYAADW